MKNQLFIMKAFYNVDKMSFKDIDDNKLSIIKKQAERLNKQFDNKNLRLCKSERYLRIMEFITANYRRDDRDCNHCSVSSQTEKFLLFMFCVDPNFEVAIIHASEDKIYDIKSKTRETLGVYDPYLIKIEKTVIKKLLSEQKRNEIYHEIEKRAFK